MINENKAINDFNLNHIETRQSKLYAIIAILSTLAINHADSTLPERSYVWIAHAITLVCLCVCWLLLLGNGLKVRHTRFFFLSLFWYVVITFHLYNNTSPNWGILTLLPILTLSLLKGRVILNSFAIYRKYLIAISAFGIFAYLSFAFGINIPHIVCPYYGTRLGDSFLYYDYFLSYIVVEDTYIRLCGLFNEPGYFGTFLSLCLIADKLNLRKKGNLFLFFAGCLTFSAAFFITIILYVTYLCIIKRKYSIIIWAIIIVVIANNIEFSNDNITRLLGRLSFTDGKLSAINRTGEALERFYSTYITSPQALFGLGNGFLSQNNFVGNLSYKSYIIEYGIIACSVYWIGLLIIGIKYAKKNSYAIAYTILFLVNVYQRPTIFVTGYMLLLIGGVYNIVCHSSNNE